MKKIVISVIVLLTTMISFAHGQVNADPSEHLTFKGVPINGTLNQYISKMKQNGFTQIGTEDGIAILKGDFAGYKNCTVLVATLKQKDLVNRITVIFPEKDTWSYLVSDYFTLKELLTEKYGEPSDCVEEFQGIVEPQDDSDKMYAVEFDKCRYWTTYEIEQGTIQVTIEHNGVISSFVMLTYQDKINNDIIRAEALKDL